MKAHHFSVEEVSEYAKYLVLTGNAWQLKEEQLYLFSQQHHRQLICHRSGYEYAVTDSPLHLSSFYAPPDDYRQLEPLIDEAYAGFENINFFLTRDEFTGDSAFESRGRVHSAEECSDMELRMREYLDRKGIVYKDLPVDLLTPWRVLEHLVPNLATKPRFDGS